MTYVMIIWVYLGSTAVSVTTHEFDSKTSCEIAGVKAQGNAGLLQGIRYACVQK